ncbi:uncharacterized protein LOC129597903 [Paramacrobiotus metropolitanus]|uniref:uncharacterized protein LOC129597903 n=1 Tax=Paramacrobiotus metropolitanus TaxID=2943436 RepID=UPI0024465804|nr:uncharacterized protein LOC129597903 [Paramacrobiotus metropolitanus]
MKWISWMENEENCVIQSVVSGTEQKIGPYYVDGYQEDTGHIYEFYGCWYHGCPTCMDPETVHPFRNLPMRDIYKETMDREQYLRSLGHPVTTVWEHDFDADLRIDSEMRKFINDIKITEPLNPRNAFYGGRTNAVRLLHTVAADEKIKYFDVNSEYPFVNKNRRYPLGHPIILTKSFQNVREYFGLVHCTVLPPGDLWLPILPYRCNGKLTFPLCATCVKEQNSKKCDHTDSERELTGTWCTPEIHAAMDRGYTVTKMYEVWHYETFDDHLFKEYIDRFLKIKTEASGWPSDVTAENEKRKYIADFEEREGVKLDYDKVKENPGLRALAKLCLNSFWGRLGMQDNKLNTMYIHDPKTFYEMLFSGKHHVHSWDLFDDNVVQITYTKEDGFIEQNPNTNVVLAAFTTCWARLHLYQFMDMAQERLLYFDTDSIFFVSKPGWPDPPTGRFLGDLTDELKPGQHITQFVSLGAKTYAYTTNDGHSVVKIKGFTINNRVKEKVNMESMMNILHKSGCIDVHYDDVIKRIKSQLILCNSDVTKRLQVTYDKRRITQDWNTVPYGYTVE